MAAPKVVATYTGTAGEFQPGIPASDLTAEQFDALDEDARTWLLANAVSDHAIYTLHGRDLKAEAKEVAADVAPPATDAAPAEVAPAPKAAEKK